jgi:hypothetical protein
VTLASRRQATRMLRGPGSHVCGFVSTADPEDPLRITDNTRTLGLTVRWPINPTPHSAPPCHSHPAMPEGSKKREHRSACGTCRPTASPLLSSLALMQVNRGTAVMVVSPSDGTDEIANPFLQQEAV